MRSLRWSLVLAQLHGTRARGLRVHCHCAARADAHFRPTRCAPGTVHYSRGGDHDAVHKAVLDLMARCTAAVRGRHVGRAPHHYNSHTWRFLSELECALPALQAPKVRRVLGYLSMQHHGKLVGTHASPRRNGSYESALLRMLVC